MKQRRGLAFYKKSGEDWKNEEYENICKYCGDDNDDLSEVSENTYIYDDHSTSLFMFSWEVQDISRCTKVAYEDIFKEEEMNEWITVKDKKELARLLESGGKWKSKLMSNNDYAYYDEKQTCPYLIDSFNNGYTTKPMKEYWNHTEWKELKYKPKNGELVWAWQDGWTTKTRLMMFNGRNGSFENCAPYNNPPKFIQKMIDNAKDIK